MISVVIPTFNRPEKILYSLNSIIHQEYNNIEIIIVDGSSNYLTRDIVKKINDNRISYYKIINFSASHSRNFGISKSKGDYIAFNDDDDEWDLEKLKKQIAVFEKHNNSDIIVYSSFIKKVGNHERMTPCLNVKMKQGNVHNELLLRNFIGLPCVILPQHICKKHLFDEELICLEDWDWLIRLSKEYTFVHIDESLVKVSNSPNSLNKSDYLVKATSYKKIYEKYFCDINMLPGIAAKHLISIGNNTCLSGDIHKGRKYIIQSLKVQSFRPISIACYLTSFLGHNAYRLIFKYLERLTHSQP